MRRRRRALDGVIRWREMRRVRRVQPGAISQLCMEVTLSSTRTPPRLHCVPPPSPASVSPHMTVSTRTVPHPTTRPASVVRSGVLQVQVYIVTRQRTNAVLSRRVLKQMAAQQTMLIVSVVQVRAVLVLVSTAMFPKIYVLDHHAQSPMDLKPTLLNLASVEMSLAMLNLVSSVFRRCWVVLVERMIQVLLVTLK